jgi:ABC-type Fe3+ transport system substrate-binding protein
MIVFEKHPKVFLENIAPNDGTIVCEANAQGVMELTRHQEKFIKKFPITYKQYIDMVKQETIHPGDVYMFTEDGYEIAIIVTAAAVVGVNKDDLDDVADNTMHCIKDLTELVSHGTMICGAINRKKFSTFKMAVEMYGKQYDWKVYAS